MRGKRFIPVVLIVCECWAGLAAAETTASSTAPAPSGPAPAPSGEEGAVQAPATDPPSEEAGEDVLVRSSAKLGGYGGPDMRVTGILGKPAIFVGAQASWLLHHQYSLGVAAYGLATHHDAPDTMRIGGDPSTLGLVYGGFRVGTVATSNRLLHVTIALLLGPGNLTGISNVLTRGEFEVGYERRLGHAEMFFVMEPEVAVEVNTTTFMRVALGGSYRYATGIEQPGLSSATLSGPSASLALKFGDF